MNDVIEYQGTAIATANQVVGHVMRVQEIMKSVMKPDVHYGVIPGTKKNTLYKPGAETLCVAFHIAPKYEVTETRFEDGVRFRVTCSGVHQGTGNVVADGVGSCSSMEEKYKWRKAYKTEWSNTSPERRRIEYGYNKAERKEYEILQVRVETADIENTLLKMACKRAFIAMVLNATAASDVFAQDLEDLSQKVVDMMADDEGASDKKAVEQPRSKSGGNGGNGAGGGNTTTDDGEPDKTPASPGMIAFLRKKLEAGALSEADAFKKFELTTFDGLTVARVNEIIKWAGNPAE